MDNKFWGQIESLGLLQKCDVFVSYRREDSQEITARLCERLIDHFGIDRIFWDLSSIPVGVAYDNFIRWRLSTSTVVLAIIGPSWEGIASGNSRRIDDPEDWVRREIEISLENRLPIVPILLLGRSMPDTLSLPEEIRGICSMQIGRLDFGIDFESHMRRLIGGVEYLLSKSGGVDSNSLALKGTFALLSAKRGCEHSVTPILTISGLTELYQIDAEAYGNANLDFEVFRNWWSLHRTGLYAISARDQIIGAIGIWPVTETWVESLLKGETSESLMQIAAPSPEEERFHCPWYVSGIVLKASARGSSLAGVLIRETLVQWALDHDLRFPVSLLALAYSEMGEKLLVKFGFELIHTGIGLPDRFPVYRREFSRASIKALMGEVREGDQY